VIDSVRNALDVGYRAIDTAQIYGNEAEVGQAIADSGVPRDDVPDHQGLDHRVQARCAAGQPAHSLAAHRSRRPGADPLAVAERQGRRADGGVPRHWPKPRRGLTREIGISNFTIAQTRKAIEILGADAIATNQIEIHPTCRTACW
jgi:2,5-diketo-D-gluconate reductase B